MAILAVPEQQLHDSDINPVFEEPGRIGVAKTMRRHRTDAGGLGDERKRAVEGAPPDRVVSGPIGEQPSRVLMKLPKAPQAPEHRIRQWDQALLVALADNCEEVLATVYCRNFQAHRLAGSQTAGVHEREAGPMDRVCGQGEQLAHLGIGNRMG